MNNPVNIDHVFKEGMGQYHEPFDENAWAKMSAKLDADRQPAAPWYRRKPFKLFFFIGAIAVLSGISAGIYKYSTGSPEKYIVNSPMLQLPVTLNETGNAGPPASPVDTRFAPLPMNNSSHAPVLKDDHKTTPSVDEKTFSMNNELIQLSLLDAPALLKLTPSSLPEIKLRGRSRIHRKHLPHHNCSHIGFHFEFQQPLNNYAATGQKPGFGFDLEGYTRNLTTSLPFAFFIGADLGMAWMGKSSYTDVVLNTANNDPGFTYLQNKKFNLDLNLKLEYGPSNLKFYAFAAAGWRQIAVDHITDSKKYLQDYTASNDYVSRTNMLEWGGGAGLRYFYRPGVSFDLRIAYMDAGYRNIVDVAGSRYDGFSARYTLNSNYIQPQVLSIRLGMMFCSHDLRESVSNGSFDYGLQGGSHTRISIGAGGGSPSPVKAKPMPRSTPR
jgi:hypothetical protein